MSYLEQVYRFYSSYLYTFFEVPVGLLYRLDFTSSFPVNNSSYFWFRSTSKLSLHYLYTTDDIERSYYFYKL